MQVIDTSFASQPLTAFNMPNIFLTTLLAQKIPAKGRSHHKLGPMTQAEIGISLLPNLMTLRPGIEP